MLNPRVKRGSRHLVPQFQGTMGAWGSKAEISICYTCIYRFFFFFNLISICVCVYIEYVIQCMYDRHIYIYMFVYMYMYRTLKNIHSR